MGELFTQSSAEKDQLRSFMKCLLNDVHALEKMVEDGLLESGVRRIGVEQEIVLVDSAFRPAPVADPVLEDLNDPAFTTEIARFNLEFNVDPLDLGGDCLSRMQKLLDDGILKVQAVAEKHGARPLLVGILPTIRKTDLTLENMTPRERYYALNETLTRMRGGAYELNIKGKDELSLKHDNIMLEACNTSFQVHFQVDPNEFAHRYNIAQAVAGPVLAAATNSPLLVGKRLWRETRIALFEQSIDTRSGHYLRDLSPRVSFGTKWIRESALEIFQEDIGRFKVLFAIDTDEDPFEKLKNGEAPGLNALRLHNGTVYRWNRACYGVMNGKAHLRIENRVLPSGPTTTDEVANAAFWFGIMSGMSVEHGDITKVMDFDDAKDNFISAATHGLGAQFTWLHGKRRTAQELILKELLPLAREGLITSRVDSSDIDKYLGVIEERVEKEATGSQWTLSSLNNLRLQGPRGEQLNAITAAMINRQNTGEPVHKWELAKLSEAGGWQENYLQVDQYMTTDLFTVSPDEPVNLVANLMDWNRIRHVLVEDEHHHLLGLVSHRALLRLYGRQQDPNELQSTPVTSIMIKNPIYVSPETLTQDAIKLMRAHHVSCLPVIKDGRLVGVVTEDNFLGMVINLLEQRLSE
ncbi:CBS domain-containing protein [bacterium]|nr:CBS domain-containing protein [bacterium]